MLLFLGDGRVMMSRGLGKGSWGKAGIGKEASSPDAEGLGQFLANINVPNPHHGCFFDRIRRIGPELPECLVDEGPCGGCPLPWGKVSRRHHLPVAPRTLPPPPPHGSPRTAEFGIINGSRFPRIARISWPPHVPLISRLESLSIQTWKSLRTLPDKHCPFLLSVRDPFLFQFSPFLAFNIRLSPKPDFLSPASTEPYARPPRCRRTRNISTGPLLTSPPRPARRSPSCPSPPPPHRQWRPTRPPGQSRLALAPALARPATPRATMSRPTAPPTTRRPRTP